jgi:predicted Holliday junction resolvase-like endonuclease
MIEDLNNIFGICPRCQEVFRASEAGLRKYKRSGDFLDKLRGQERKNRKYAFDYQKQKETIRVKGVRSGRAQAEQVANNIDSVFHPLGLTADDAKLIMNPVDFIVFDGMHKDKIGENLERIVVVNNSNNSCPISSQVKQAIEEGRYEFATLKINYDGSIEER